MSYIPSLTLADGPQLDAFGRLRVSSPYTLFSSKLLADAAPLFFDDRQISGAGTSSTYNTNQSSVTMAVSNNTAGLRCRQSKMRFNYQPGKSQEAVLTFVMGAGVSGVTKRAGYFDVKNGVYFYQSGATLGFGVRTFFSGSAVDVLIPQSTWNIDKLDGTGPSGLTLDVTKNQILFMDLQWLGVGRVRFGFVINGLLYYAHYSNHANQVVSLTQNTGVYMSSPNLPVRFDIQATGTNGVASFECICAEVSSEGGQQPAGTTVAADRGMTSISLPNDSVIYPLICMRLKQANIGTQVNLLNLSMMTTTATSAFRYALLLNPTFAGTALVWNAITNSAIEYAVPTTGTSVTGGFQMSSGYVQQNRTASVEQNVDTLLRLGATAEEPTPTMDIIALCAQNNAVNNTVTYAGLEWAEIG